MLTTFSCVNARGSEYLKSKIDFSSSVLEFCSNLFRIETTLPSCVFSIIIVGVKNWLILKKSIFSIFYRFQTLLRKAQNGGTAVDDFVADAEKISKTWLYHLQTLGSCRRTSTVSYLWIFFGRVADICFFRKWIFAKKSLKKGSTQKYPLLFRNHP